MSDYFITDKSRIESIIPFGFRDMENARIYASVIQQGIFIKPYYDADKIEFDFESFFELYDEYQTSFDIYKKSAEKKHNMNVRKNMWWPQSEAQLGSSVRVCEGMVIFNQLKYTDDSIPFAQQYEVTKKNPMGLDKFRDDEIMLNPVKIYDGTEFSFRHMNTIRLSYLIPIKHDELGKFVSLSELNKVYQEVMELSGSIDS